MEDKKHDKLRHDNFFNTYFYTPVLYVRSYPNYKNAKPNDYEI